MKSLGKGPVAGGAARQRSSVVAGARCLAWLAALLVATRVALADGPDDQYVHILGIVEQAQDLETNGKTAPALAKYQEAQKALRQFRKENPTWNAKTVGFRLSSLGEKVAALSGGGGVTADTAKPPGPKLLQAGADPKRVLRLKAQPGAKQSLGMAMTMNVTMEMAGMQPPAMKLPGMNTVMDTTVKSVSPDGEITYELVITDATVAEDSGAMPQVVEMLKGAANGLKGAVGTGRLSNRGTSKSLDFKLAQATDPQVKQTAEQLKEAFERLMVPLPEEAVGPGAKWEVKQQLKTQGMMVDESKTFELVSVEGDKLSLKGTIVDQAANQKMENPAMPGLKLDLVKMNGQCTNELVLELGNVVPIQGSMKSHSDVVAGMDAGGQKQTMTMHMDIELRLEPK